MPIYEYKCEDCKANFELLVKTGDDTVECLGCGGTNLQKKVSTTSSKSNCGDGGCTSCSGCGH